MLSGKWVSRASRHAGQVWPRGRRASSRRSGSRARWTSGSGAVVGDGRDRRSGTPLLTLTAPGATPPATGTSWTMPIPSGPNEHRADLRTAPCLTIHLAATRLNLSYNAVRNLILTGRLIAYKFMGTYRIKPEDLDAFVENCRIRPSRPNSKSPARGAKAGGSRFKHVDAQRSLAAWRRQGEAADPPCAHMSQSPGSSCDPSTPPTS